MGDVDLCSPQNILRQGSLRTRFERRSNVLEWERLASRSPPCIVTAVHLKKYKPVRCLIELEEESYNISAAIL